MLPIGIIFTIIIGVPCCMYVTHIDNENGLNNDNTMNETKQSNTITMNIYEIIFNYQKSLINDTSGYNRNSKYEEYIELSFNKQTQNQLEKQTIVNETVENELVKISLKYQSKTEWI